MRAGRCVRRARRIVDPIATTMNGTMITGCMDSVHSFSRAVKNAAVYGGGSAASAKLADEPQMPITQHASPAIMPKPTDINIGPSAFSAEPNENRLVRKCQPNTDSRMPPKITHVVGCVNAAAIPIRNSAVRAPHDSRASSRNGIVRHSSRSTVALSRYPMYGVDRNSATEASRAMWITTGFRRLRKNAAPRASPARIGMPTMNSVLNV